MSGPYPTHVAFTGRLKTMTRNEACSLAWNADLRPSFSFGHQADLLVAADPSGQSPKMKKAKSRGIEIISEEEFIKRCGGLGKVSNDITQKREKVKEQKKRLDWKQACKALCKKLGLKISITSKVWAPDYDNRQYFGTLTFIDLFDRCQLCRTNTADYKWYRAMYKWYRSIAETDEDSFSTEEAYKNLCWHLGQKSYLGTKSAVIKVSGFVTSVGRMPCRYLDNLKQNASYDPEAKRKLAEFMAWSSSFPEFGTPESADEMKLKLEVLGFSIMD